MHLEAISNGQGGQSIYLGYLVSIGKIKTELSITADTGEENDCLWSTGERTTAKEFFEQVTKPVFKEWGIEAVFVRALRKDGSPLPRISESYYTNETFAPSIPLYNVKINKKGGYGQLNQSCTSKWKIAAIHQEARRRGAKTFHSFQGIHYGEAARRVKGLYIGKVSGFDTYKQQIKDKKTGSARVVKWLSHSYPLVDMRLNRFQIRAELDRLGIPYLVSSECDDCPHKDAARWLRTSRDTLVQIARREAGFNGEFFYTPLRIPLLEAIEKFKQEEAQKGYLFADQDLDFGCDKPVCGT